MIINKKTLKIMVGEFVVESISLGFVVESISLEFVLSREVAATRTSVG
jgi:hypothetical protein